MSRKPRSVKLSSDSIFQLYQGSVTGDHAGARKNLLQPGSFKLLTWEVVSFFLLLYTAVAVPFQLAFSNKERWDPTQWTTYWETLVDVFFILDIVRNFFTAYYEHGKLILDQWQICRSYLRTWFLVDFVASFPLDWFIGFTQSDDEGGGQTQLLLLLRLSKLWKLLRLLRLWRVGLRSKLNVGTGVAGFIFGLTGSASFWFAMNATIVYLVTHVFGCLQVFLATLNDDFNDGEDGSWLVRAGLSGKSVEEQYAGAMVHALLQARPPRPRARCAWRQLSHCCASFVADVPRRTWPRRALASERILALLLLAPCRWFLSHASHRLTHRAPRLRAVGLSRRVQEAHARLGKVHGLPSVQPGSPAAHARVLRAKVPRWPVLWSHMQIEPQSPLRGAVSRSFGAQTKRPSFATSRPLCGRRHECTRAASSWPGCRQAGTAITTSCHLHI